MVIFSQQFDAQLLSVGMCCSGLKKSQDDQENPGASAACGRDRAGSRDHDSFVVSDRLARKTDAPVIKDSSCQDEDCSRDDLH